ncbi:MAG: hypothetical protein LBO21_10660 [Synergistaceae bacterium]|jgi:hypothetical protein|nr:hypothetical protein [Synergistaceae bacterium]
MPAKIDKKATAPSGRVAIQTRFDEETYAKGKVLSAIYGESFNALLVRSLQNEIRRYEDRYGDLPPHVEPGG